MLATAPVKNIGYYEELAAEDYYLQGGEPPGQYFGQGAESLGLRGTVGKLELSYLMDGRSPDGKTILRQNTRNSQRVPAYDCVFSPTKSVSIIWAAADADERSKIQSAHDNAVKAALQFLEMHAAYTRRGHNGGHYEQLSGLVIATYQHSTSREQDPQLHTHAVILNVAERDDGSWGTIVGRKLFTWRTAASAVYQCQLARELKLLGYKTCLTANEKSFEIYGVPTAICQHFSKRSKQIKAELAKYGSVARASAVGDKITRFTRQKKGTVDRPALFSQWQRELCELGFDASKLKTSSTHAPESGPKPPLFNTSTLLKRITETVSVFSEADLYREAALLGLATGQSGNQAQLLGQRTLEDSDVLHLTTDSQQNRLFSTQQILDAESQMVSLARALRQRQFNCIVPEAAIRIACKQQNLQLTDEQFESVLEATGPNMLAIIQGSAGAGKSTAMWPTAAIFKKCGASVIGTTHTRAAALNLEQSAGIEAHTITRLLGLLDSSKPPLKAGDVLIVDEAGQVSMPNMLTLMQHANDVGFKLILVGEDKQLDAISHGGVLRYLSSPAVIGTTRIETIKRQINAWDRQAVADFRDGRANHAIAQYAKRGQLIFGHDHEQTLALMLDAWKRYTSATPDGAYLMMAHRWDTVDQINTLAREHLRNMDRIGDENVAINGVVSDRQIEFLVSVGERLRLTKNDYKQDFTNGNIGTVIMVKQNAPDDVVMQIRLDSGRTIKIRTSEYCDDEHRTYLTPAYAQTVYSSQGLTVPGETFIHYSSSMDRAHSYVACSRHKIRATIFANASDIEEHIPASHEPAPRQKQLMAGLAACMTYENRPRLAIELISTEQNSKQSQTLTQTLSPFTEVTK